MLPVIQTGALQRAIIKSKPDRSHNPQLCVQRDTRSAYISRVLRDFRLVQHNIHSRSLFEHRFFLDVIARGLALFGAAFGYNKGDCSKFLNSFSTAMPIPVTCPGCLARFTVSDKFAGKQGPCPKCKQVITVPDKSQEVVIHAPETSGPKDPTGRPVLTPLRRVEFDPSTLQIVLASSVATFCLIGAILLRLTAQSPPTWILAIAAIALAYPLSAIGYTFFKDDELGGYIGRERWVRLGACAAVFAGTWGLYAFLAYYFGNRTLADVEPIQMAIFLALMFGLGIAVSVGACELEVGQSFLHYSIYFIVTVILALIAGVEIAQPLARTSKADPYGIPSAVRASPSPKP
jgi:hypothetical protein